MTATNLPLSLNDEKGNVFHLSEEGIRFVKSKQTQSTLLSNFCLLVQDFFVLTGENDTVEGPLFRLLVTRGSETVLLPESFSTQSLLKWLKNMPDPRLTIFPRSKACQMIADCVRLQLQGNPRKIFSVTHPGWSHLDKHWIYVLGDTIFLPQGLNLCDIHWNGKGSLRVYEGDSGADEANQKLESAAWFLLLARSIPQVSTPLCLYFILTLIYTRLIHMGVSPTFWLWMVGHSGSGKTSICKQTLCFFPDSAQTPFTVSLTGTSAGINQILADRYDAPLLLDDFSSSEGTQQQKLYQDLIDAIMRHSTNGSGRHTKNGLVETHCLPVVTAEISLKSYSLASRTLSVFIPSGIDFSLFDQIQQNPHLVSFVNDFLVWLVENPGLFDIFSDNKAWLLSPDHHRPFADARLCSNMRFLYAAQWLLFEYLENIGFSKPRWKGTRKYLLAELKKLGEINHTYLCQLKQNKLSENGADWILALSHALLSKRCFRFGKNAGELINSSIDACWHKDDIAVKPDAVLRFLKHSFPMKAWDKQTIYRALDTANLVKPGKDGKTTRVIGKYGRVLVFDPSSLRIYAAAVSSQN